MENAHYVVHSAASIRFDNPIHTDLTLSYVATQALANLATQVLIDPSTDAIMCHEGEASHHITASLQTSLHYFLLRNALN